MHKLVASFLFLLAFLGAAGTANAASGTAMGVDPEAEARGAETRTLVVGADVFIGDRIVTGPRGQVQILFSDKTELVVGPRSALVIEDYLLRDDGSAGRMVLDALGGTFRFVTGGAPKDRYQINTPGGTISVRGTGLEIWVDWETGIAYVLVQQGAITGCSTGGDCTPADNRCEVLQIATSGTDLLGGTGDITGELRDQLKDWFKYAVDQSNLERPFWIDGGLDCLRRDPPSGGGGSMIEQGPGGNGRGNDEYYERQVYCEGGYDAC